MTRKNSKKIRYAVVGLGNIAQGAVLPAFKNARKNSELVALVSGDPQKLAKVGRRYRIPKSAQFAYQDYPECLDRLDVDAVYLCLPNDLHFEYAEKALRAGVHVLCEKPLGVSSEECQKLATLSRQLKLRFMTAYRMHFEKSHLEVIRLAHRQKRLGDLRIFNSLFSYQIKDRNNIRLNPTARGGGALWDIGIYCLNAARSIFQSEPMQVFAIDANNGDPRFKKTHEMISVILKFPQERLATFTCSFGADTSASYEVIGTKGRVRVDKAFEYVEARELTEYRDAKAKTRVFKKSDQFAPELLYFSECVLKKKDPEPSALEGRADVRVIEAILESAQTQRPIFLSGHTPKAIRHPHPKQLIQRPGIDKPEVFRAPSASS